MKNTLHSPLSYLFKFYLKLNKKSLSLLTLITFLMISNYASAQLPVTYDFESGFQGWTSNGNDSGRYNSSGWACSGNRSIYSKDDDNNRNRMESPILNLSGYTDITISFCHKSVNLDNGEGFRIEYFDGSNWSTIQTFIYNIDFFGQGTGNAHNLSFSMSNATYTFATNSRFRFYGTANNNNEWNFFDNINITGVLAPTLVPNDNCSNAIVLTPNSTCIYTLADTENATQSLPGCVGDADDDVWFSFTATSTSHLILVDPTTLNDAVFEIFDGCGGTSLACVDNTGGGLNESITQTGLTIGNTYFIRVYSYYTSSFHAGEFNICITSPPVNDECANAITLVSDLTCNYTLGTTDYASQSLPGCTGTANDDVWFSFTAITTQHTIEVDVTTLNDAVIEIFDSCGGTSLGCRDSTGGWSNESLTLNGLNIGDTYYIRVYSYSSNTNNQGEFNICLTSPCVPSNALGTSTLGCPFVELGGVGLGSTAPPIVDCSIGETTIEASYLELGDTSSYTAEAIPYNPPFQFSCLENPVSVNLDDVWSPAINLPFDFCFYGNTYSSLVIGSNGVISFDNSLANGSSGWNTTRAIPNTVNATDSSGIYYFGPSIYGVHHDVDPSIGGEIGYQLITLDSGCQALVAAWSDVPMYLDNTILYSGMIVFYENTNIIEVYVKEKNIDGGAPWNDGNASIGLQKNSSTATTIPGRNTLDPNWTATNEAWRFVPSGSSITDLKWYENSISAANEVIDPNDDNLLVVAPSATTTYFAEVTYTLCDGSTIVETNSTTVTIDGIKTWNGSVNTDWNNPNNWTPLGVPITTDCILIPNTGTDPIIVGTVDGFGYNLEIENGATLLQQPESSLQIEDKIVVDTNAEFEIRDSANLIQITDVATNQNIGNAKVQREVIGLTNYDYVYWSSPVTTFDVFDVSPGSSSSAVWKWIPTVNNGSAGKHGEWSNTYGNMILGQGYAIRDLEGTTLPDTAEFIGGLNNGQISHSISRNNYTSGNYAGIGNTATAEDDNWNLVGNPYPSAISLTDFTAANPHIDGTLYFWRHTAPPSTVVGDPFYEGFAYNYSANDYLSANSLGSTPNGFNGYIASGQGFFVQLLDSSPVPYNLVFNNTMRGNYSNKTFYRGNNASFNETETEKHRIWLDLISENNTALPILIGYADGAEDGIDRLFDGYHLNQSENQFYSVLTEDSKDNNLTINGRALPFDETDTIPLGFKTPVQGDFTIAINTTDGLFAYSNQNIYLEDTELNIIHDLKSTPYAFTTDIGTFNDRFILRFTTQSLSITDEEATSNLDIRTINQTVVATSNLSTIKTFKLFDVTGRLIHKNIQVESTDYSYQTNELSSGTYIVTVSLENGAKVSKKIII